MNSPKHPPRETWIIQQSLSEFHANCAVGRALKPREAIEVIALSEHEETVSTLLEALRHVQGYFENNGMGHTKLAGIVLAAIDKAGA